MTPAEPSQYQYRDLGGLTQILKVALLVYLGVTTINLWSSWLQIDLLERIKSGGDFTQAEADANDSREAVLGVAYLLIMAITGFIFLRWTNLSKKNAYALGATDMVISPAWAVGWYFVPVAALWKPYQAVKETFQASNPEHSGVWQDAPTPGLLPQWWFLWIVSCILAQMSFRLSNLSESVDGFILGTWLQIGNELLDIPLSIVVFILVQTLYFWQTEKHQAQAPVASAEPW